MSFYNKIAKYYEYIFPADLSTITFLINHMKNNGKILDVSCGAGEYSIGLTQNNYDVIGIDSEEEMIKIAQNKANKLHLNVDFRIENMTSLKNSFNENTFSGIFCIGNSLVHLDNYDEIYITLKNMYDLLKDKGSLILQLTNFDKIETSKVTIPKITNKAQNLEFTREFFICKNNELYLKNKLSTPLETLDYSIKLYPITISTLKETLDKIGFRNIYLYSNFNGSVFNKESSSDLVLTCKK